MRSQLAILTTTVLLTLGFSQTAAAAEQQTRVENTQAPAKIVVYRSEERSKSKRIRFMVTVNDQTVGRLNYTDAVVTTVPAGTYTINTSIAGSKGVTLDLKPGQTHYVYTEVSVLGYKVRSTLNEVEEQVALVQRPTIAGTI